MEFNKKDVWAVARALGNGLVFREYSSSCNSWVRCRHCGREIIYNEDDHVVINFKHRDDCVIITAKDILTGAK